MKKLIATLSALTFAAGVLAAEAPAPTGSAPKATPAATAKAPVKKAHKAKLVKKGSAKATPKVEASSPAAK